MTEDPHKALRDDVRLLGRLFGETLRNLEGDRLFALVEEVRALAKRAHASDPNAFEQLADRLSDLPIGAAVPIARAFAQFLALANIAEQHHRVRRRREYVRQPGRRAQPGSCADAFSRWRDNGLSTGALADALKSLRIELVLTAHPTEMVRRTLLQAHRRIADVLTIRDRSDLTPDESDAAMDALRREIATAWQTEEVRDRAVSPLDEVRGGLAVFEQTLWEALPRYMRQIDRALGEVLRARRRAVALRLLDRRRSRRQSQRDGRDHAQGDMDGAMDRRRPVPRARSTRCAGNCRSARRATNCVTSSATATNRIARCCAISRSRLHATRAYAAARIED